MQKSIGLFVIVTFFTAMLHAEMKCAPGKCGVAMSSKVKQTVKTFFSQNIAYKVIDVKANEYRCATCKMNVSQLDYVTQAVTKNGNTYFFDDIGCMILWMERNSTRVMKQYVKTLDTHRWMEAEKVYYSRIAPSPMGYGFAPVEVLREGLISYSEMKVLMLEGETLRNPDIKKRLISQ